MFNLKGKTAIVSGASSGIGRAAAKLFATHGARIVVTARRAAELDAVVREIKAARGEAVAVAGDIRDANTAEAAVEAAERRFGGLDIAFNNAGAIPEMGPAHEISLEGWRETLDINLTGAFLAARSQVPAMLRRGGGSMIFSGTFVGQTVGFAGLGAYGAAKAGVVGLVRGLAAELGPQGVRVNAILSGGADTPMNAEVLANPEALATVKGLHALKRIAAPHEIAQAALYLASEAASFVTGSAMAVDGGVSISRS